MKNQFCKSFSAVVEGIIYSTIAHLRKLIAVGSLQSAARK